MVTDTQLIPFCQAFYEQHQMMGDEDSFVRHKLQVASMKYSQDLV